MKFATYALYAFYYTFFFKLIPLFGVGVVALWGMISAGPVDIRAIVEHIPVNAFYFGTFSVLIDYFSTIAVLYVVAACLKTALKNSKYF